MEKCMIRKAFSLWFCFHFNSKNKRVTGKISLFRANEKKNAIGNAFLVAKL